MRRLTTREIAGLAIVGALALVYHFDLVALARGYDDRFPEHVRVSAQPPVNLYAGQPELRVLQLLDSVNAMWTQAFAAADDRYKRPIIKPSATRPTEGCGSDGGGWVGLYCARGRVIVIDLSQIPQARQRYGEQFADDVLAYVLAHEVGHHVQAQRGLLSQPKGDDVIRAELHAQCLAGLYGRATKRSPPPEWTYAADEVHGTVAQQRHWLELGHRTGRPAACDAVWDGELRP